MPRFRMYGPLGLAAIVLSVAAVAQSTTKPTTADSTPQVMHVLGLEDVKQNVKGKLTVNADGLDFKGSASHALIRTASIEDMFTGEDSRQTGGKVLTLAKMGVPYGGGRFLSLFTHEKFDSLTLEYRDDNGALHGVIFTMPAGQASDIKKALMAQGAKASMPASEPAAPKDAAQKEKQ